MNQYFVDFGSGRRPSIFPEIGITCLFLKTYVISEGFILGGMIVKEEQNEAEYKKYLNWGILGQAESQ